MDLFRQIKKSDVPVQLKIDRNVNEELGLDSPKPKVWRVYERKRGKRVTK